MSSRSFYAARLVTALIVGAAVVAGAVIVAPAAYAGTDDYPSKWKKPARDSMFDDWGEYNRECTSWVAWRLHGHNQFEMPFHANADDWGSRAKKLGYTVNMTPAVGSVAWWDTSTRSHVAWVEAVNPNKTVTIEEYNIGGSGRYDETTIPITNPTGYIHFQDLATSFADGSYITYGSNVYRMAGGAPIYISSWAKFGKTPSGLVTATQWKALDAVPADGTFLVAKTSGKVYRIVGGAPIYISSWDEVGGVQPSTTVPDEAIANAGSTSSSVWDHLTRHPTGTPYVVASPSNAIYKITGGAPDPVTDWASVGGQQPFVQIGDDDIAKAGVALAAPYGNLLGVLAPQPVRITGTTKVGHVLTAHAGSWGKGVRISYRWMRNGVAITPHGSQYTISQKSAHSVITVQIKASKSGYRTVVVVSPGTAVISK